MKSDYINLKALNLNELAGVVNLYPWYGVARKELSYRMTRLGGDAWGVRQYSDAALYMPDRSVVADMLRDKTADYSDKDLKELLRNLISKENAQEEAGRRVKVAGGDFFSQDQYDRVKRDEDNVFSHFASKSRPDRDSSPDEIGDEFCTETLAQIYYEQGYPDRAKRIYSVLLLKFPEKSAYFATLIRKIEAEEAAQRSSR